MFTSSNIQSTFAATGIYFYNLSIIFNQINIKILMLLTNKLQIYKQIPTILQTIKRHIKTIQKNQSTLENKVDQLARTTKKLIISKEILQHEINRLQKTLSNKKKR